jgi:glycine cleavage system regulatory protein
VKTVDNAVTSSKAAIEVGGNWLESHLSRLGGKYVGSVLVDLPAERLSDLEEAMRKIDAIGVKVELVTPQYTTEREGKPPDTCRARDPGGARGAGGHIGRDHGRLRD